MNPDQIETLVEAIRAGLEGDAIDKIVITIKPKPTPNKK